MANPTSASLRPGRVAAPVLWRPGEGLPPEAPFVALAPGAEAPLIALSLPATLTGPAREDVARRQALDRLGLTAGAVDARPARLGTGEGWSRVVVCDPAALARWRSMLGAAAARCRALVPDYLALPAAPDLWVIEAGPALVRARLGVADGFSAEPDLAVLLLRAAADQARAAGVVPRAVLLTGPRAAALAPALSGLPVIDSDEGLPEALRPRVFAHGELAVDLARDPQADAETLARWMRRLLLPVVLIALGLAGWGAATGIAARQDHAAASAIAARTLEAARRDILGEGPVLDLRVQVARAIEARRRASVGAGGELLPLDLLRLAAPVLAGEGDESGPEVRALALGPGTDGVSVDLGLADFRALDALMARLAETGLAARVARSGIEPGGGVGATVDITGVTP